MKTNFTDFFLNADTPERVREALVQFARELEQTFEGVPEDTRRTYTVALNFSAPGAVPGFTDQVLDVSEVEMGDTVIVGCSIVPPAGFMPPVGFVSAAGEVTVRWLQVSGAPANPDGAGASYTLDIWRH